MYLIDLNQINTLCMVICYERINLLYEFKYPVRTFWVSLKFGVTSFPELSNLRLCALCNAR